MNVTESAGCTATARPRARRTSMRSFFRKRPTVTGTATATSTFPSAGSGSAST